VESRDESGLWGPPQADLAALLAHTSDLVITTQARCIVGWNDQAEKLLGWKRDDVIGRPIFEVLRPAGDVRWEMLIAAFRAATPGPFAVSELPVQTAAGAIVSYDGILFNEASLSAPCTLLLRDPTPRLLQEEIQRERTELASEAAGLWHRAFHDPLTNLANRDLFRQRLEQALEHGVDRLVAVLVLDLDGFKTVNDALGHRVAEDLLVEVADRLRSCLGPKDTVARHLGDQFAVLLDGIERPEAATDMADRIIDQLHRPFHLDGRVLVVATNIGIVVADGQQDADAMLRDADVALYNAKSQGRATVVCFERTMQQAALDRLELEADLRAAIAERSLHLHYQPIANLRTGEIVGVEALTRWTHPVRGFVPPVDFIPVAEDTGLIVALGDWVLREACRQARVWHDRYPDRPPVSMAVNLSGTQLQLPDFARTVAAILVETGLRPDALVLEITESQVMEHMTRILGNLHELQALGVRLSIDDFGTGYSSLARLRSLPVDELKIDRSFVQEIDGPANDATLVGAIIAMAHGLNLHVVGEGVETAEQLEVLLRSGCDRVQGYLLGRPASPELVEDLLVHPVLVLRLAAAAAALGSAGSDLDVDVTEALASVLAEAVSADELISGMLELLLRITGLEAGYVTRVLWDRQEQVVMSVLGDCGLAEGTRFSWAGAAAPDVYGDARVRGDDGRGTYLSVPIVGSNGGLLGTLCAVSGTHRALTRSQLAGMEVLARLIGDELSAGRSASVGASS
jgi:diguanylate cyclase (GGDEF)-like protein